MTDVCSKLLIICENVKNKQTNPKICSQASSQDASWWGLVWQTTSRCKQAWALLGPSYEWSQYLLCYELMNLLIKTFFLVNM